MTRLDDFRRRKDEFFRRDPHSPLEPEQRERFASLSYYPERPDLSFDVTLDRTAIQETMVLDTTTGDPRELVPAGWARLTIEGQPVSLLLFREPGRGRYFLPFRDGTAGDETYSLGRYLDPQDTPAGTIRIDFNYAYNPYCAYNDAWSCPIPPDENITEVPIRAGEKQFILE